MTAADLMGKLLEIERSVGQMGFTNIRRLVMDAEDGLLEIERRVIQTLCDNQRLREVIQQMTEAFAGGHSIVAGQEAGAYIDDFAPPEGDHWTGSKYGAYTA
jgi:hypothetical protein